MKTVTVKLQDGLVLVETDPASRLLPSALWKEIQRVGFVPGRMEIWATGAVESDAFVVGGARWPLSRPAPATASSRTHLRVTNGAEDPPRVEILDAR